VAVCLCSKKAGLSDRSELYSPVEHATVAEVQNTPTFACDMHHMQRTVDEKTLAERIYDER